MEPFNSVAWKFIVKHPVIVYTDTHTHTHSPGINIRTRFDTFSDQMNSIPFPIKIHSFFLARTDMNRDGSFGFGSHWPFDIKLA